MSNIKVQLGVANPLVETTLDVSSNPVQPIGDDQYLPITIEAVQADIVASVIPIATQSKLKAEVAGAFDKVRVGDFVSAIATGSLTAKPNILLTDAYIGTGLNYIVYPATYTSTTLGVKSGDTITVASAGTGIPANTVITKIDYEGRRIFLDKLPTESKVADVTVTPKIRVTAVRTSTALANPNEIDFDSTVAATGVAGNATIKGGAVDAVLTVLRIRPIDSAVDSKATINVAASALDGSHVKGSPDGGNGLNLAGLNYVEIGRYQTDLDTFRTLAGVAAPTAV